MANVVYLPGCLGSCLGLDRGPGLPAIPIWPDPAAILGGGMGYLQLAADGVSPGPLARGATVVPTGVFGPVYGPLALQLYRAGHQVLPVPYDWRVSVEASAAAVWAATLRAFGDKPISIVAHSQGGLVALAVYALMSAQGRDAQLTRLVTLCTPFFGSLEPVRMWQFLPYLYRSLAVASGWRGFVGGRPGPAYLSEVLATMPCWYELTAFRDNGPLAIAQPAQARAIYQAASYPTGNPFLMQSLMDAAAEVQDALVGSAPAGRLTTILGGGASTAYQLAGDLPTSSAAGYLYTAQGDALVTLAQGTYPGVEAIQIPADHALILLDPRTAPAVLSALALPAPAVRLAPRPAALTTPAAA